MALRTILLFLTAILFGCVQDETEAPHRNDEQEVVADEPVIIRGDTGICVEICGSFGWIGGAGGDAIHRGLKRMSTPATYRDVIDELNGRFDAAQPRGLALVNPILRNDTLYVDLENAHIFTQQMGTTGAMIAKAVIVYSLTEDQNVRHVALRYEEGDHGGPPGVFERDDVDDDLTIDAEPDCSCRSGEPVGSEKGSEWEGGRRG